MGKGFLPTGPSIRRTVRAGKQSLCRLSPSPVDCPAAAGRLSPAECTAKIEFFFLRERRGNVYENKGPLWKSGNEAGMFMKIKVVIRLKRGCI